MNITNNILQILNNIKKLYQQSANVTVAVKKLQGDSSVSLAEVLNDISLLSNSVDLLSGIVGQIQLESFEPFQLTGGGITLESPEYKLIWNSCILDPYMYKLWEKNSFELNLVGSSTSFSIVVLITGEVNLTATSVVAPFLNASNEMEFQVADTVLIDNDTNEDVSSDYLYLCLFFKDFVENDFLAMVLNQNQNQSELGRSKSDSTFTSRVIDAIDTITNNTLDTIQEK